MAKRTVVAPFTLNTHDAERKFVPGDCIEGEVAAHWYAQYHSVAAPAGSETEKPAPAAGAGPQKPPSRRRG